MPGLGPWVLGKSSGEEAREPLGSAGILQGLGISHSTRRRGLG